MHLGELLQNKPVDLASAATTDLASIGGASVNVTGTTTITSFGSGRAGLICLVSFAGALTLTHHATNLVLPGGANITTAAGDWLLARSDGSSAWSVPFYQRAAGGLIAPYVDAGIASVTPGNANGEISGLTFSASPTQAECEALRDKCEELADDTRNAITALNAVIAAVEAKNVGAAS